MGDGAGSARSVARLAAAHSKAHACLAQAAGLDGAVQPELVHGAPAGSDWFANAGATVREPLRVLFEGGLKGVIARFELVKDQGCTVVVQFGDRRTSTADLG